LILILRMQESRKSSARHVYVECLAYSSFTAYPTYAPRDIAKIAVIERHLATGNVSLSLVKGLGMQRGAIASTVAHDSHNLIVSGMDNRSMMTAIHTVVEMRGAMAAALDESVLGRFPLLIAGLMSDQPVERVRDQMDELLWASRTLGTQPYDPFMVMSFLALPVIPALKITDKGLVDVGPVAHRAARHGLTGARFESSRAATLRPTCRNSPSLSRFSCWWHISVLS
jgi:adenine deaminase